MVKPAAPDWDDTYLRLFLQAAEKLRTGKTDIPDAVAATLAEWFDWCAIAIEFDDHTHRARVSDPENTPGVKLARLILVKEKHMADTKIPPTEFVVDGPMTKAKRIVFLYVKERLEKTDTHVTFIDDDVYVVWFCKTLQNWKALVSTTLPDGMYYEVTYNGDRREIYLDAYKKFDNVCISD